MRSHWSFRKLSAALAREGFDVFRFDYHATGDSSGDGREASTTRWVEDVKTAAEELRDVSGVKKVAVVGMRLGAALAAEACAGGLSASPLVLWDPVVSGRSYLAELRRLQAWKFASALYPPEPGADGRHAELLGFPFTLELERQVTSVDLTRVEQWPSEKVVLVVSEEKPEYASLRQTLEGKGVKLDYRRVEETAAPGATLDSVLLSQGSLNAIVGALVEASR
jgi:pimeloyl-ACP methyl ester carboxylesterase